MQRILLFVCLCIFSLLFSCRKELEKPSWDTHDLAPLIDASLDINNLLPDSILQTNADSSMKIVFQNNIFNFSMDTLFKIPDTSLVKSYVIPISITAQPGQAIVTNNLSETGFNLHGAQLRTIVIKSGSINYSIKSTVHEVTHFVYGLPCATLNGVPFTIDINVPAAVGNTPGVYNQTFDLSGYTLSLTGIKKNKVNTMFTSLTASISSAGQPVVVGPTDSLVISNTFKDFVPYYAKGYFGQSTFNVGPSESNFTMFKRIVDGSIKLEDVNFNLKIENPIGLDAQIVINNLNSINTKKGTNIGLSNSVIGSPININRAAESEGKVFSTTNNFPLNGSNSNIKTMLENLPNKFGYSLKMVTNPLGNISSSNDFIYADKLLKATMNMEIPLSMVANDLTLVDTLKLNINGNNAAKNVNNGKLTLVVNNGFPFHADIQMYLLNDNNVVVDSLLHSVNTIDAAPINSNFRAYEQKNTNIIIPISDSKMDLLYNTKNVIFKIKFNTSEQPQYMKIYNNYKIDLKLIGDFNYTIQLK
jgi:hypothetical protein